MSEFIETLRRLDFENGGSTSFGKAADRIEELERELAEAKARFGRDRYSLEYAQQARAVALEEAARVIDENQEAVGVNGGVLISRDTGDLHGLAFAAAIRALIASPQKQASGPQS